MTPSFVITTSPIESTNILSIPLGPKVERTASAMALAAAILFCVALRPLSLFVPSLRITTGALPGIIIPHITFASPIYKNNHKKVK